MSSHRAIKGYSLEIKFYPEEYELSKAKGRPFQGVISQGSCADTSDGEEMSLFCFKN